MSSSLIIKYRLLTTSPAIVALRRPVFQLASCCLLMCTGGSENEAAVQASAAAAAGDTTAAGGDALSEAVSGLDTVNNAQLLLDVFDVDSKQFTEM